MKLTKNQIKKQLSLNSALLRNYHICRVGIFGSYVRDEQSEESDIDIIVDFDRPVDLFAYANLVENLSSIVGAKVDLVSVKGLKPALRSKILEEVEWIEGV
ncbi:MAG TPA: nucleotidyltransferase family protein [Spirochaetota bacterium]|nr:nucleotidyltransferase family protein [Spirochaetota bacterium]